MGKVYLLHFDRPYWHARHYLGFTGYGSVKKRFADHVAGRGARLTQVVVAAGIGLQLAWVRDGDRRLERQLKNRHNAKLMCPICERERKRCR